MKGLWLALGSHLWQSTIVLVLVALAARMLRRAPARAQEALWTAALLKLALPGSFLAPLFGPLLAGWSPEPGSSSVGDAYFLMVRVASPDLGVVTPDSPAADVGPGWVVLTLAWLVISGALMLHWWRRRRRDPDRGRPLDRLPEPLRHKVSDALSGTGFEAARVRLRSGAAVEVRAGDVRGSARRGHAHGHGPVRARPLKLVGSSSSSRARFR